VLPALRHLAKEMKVDITSIVGTGKDGRVTLEDIRREAAPASPGTGIPHLSNDEEVPLVGIRNLMAEKMTESKNKIPYFSFFEELDATRLVQLKQRCQEKGAKENIHITYVPFIIKALSLSLKQYPEVNSSLDSDHKKLIIHKHHNIGIAMTTPYGLIVPVLKDV